MRKLGALLIVLVAGAGIVSPVRAQPPSPAPVALWVAGPGATEAHVALAASTLTARGVPFVEHERVDVLVRAALQGASGPPNPRQGGGIAAALGAATLLVVWLDPPAGDGVRVRVFAAPAGYVFEERATPDEAGAALAGLLGRALDAVHERAPANSEPADPPPTLPPLAPEGPVLRLPPSFVRFQNLSPERPRGWNGGRSTDVTLLVTAGIFGAAGLALTAVGLVNLSDEDGKYFLGSGIASAACALIFLMTAAATGISFPGRAEESGARYGRLGTEPFFGVTF